MANLRASSLLGNACQLLKPQLQKRKEKSHISPPFLIPTQRNPAIPWRKKACWTEAPAQVGHFNPLSEGEQSHCCQARANAQTFYTTIFVVGSNGLVSETSAENQTSFVHSSASLTLLVAEATALDCFSGFVNGRQKQQTSLL